MSLLHWGLHIWMHYSRWGLTSAEQRGRITSLELLATLLPTQTQDTVGFLGCEGTLLAHVQLPCTSISKSFSARLCSVSFIPQLVLIAGNATTQVQDLTLGFVEPHEALLCPLFEPVWISAWPPIPQVFQPRDTGWCYSLTIGWWNYFSL